MPDKKLTDAEIVKAVKSYEEKILANGIKSLEPFEVREIVERQQEEINRLQAEIERLNKCRKEEVEKLMSATDKVILEAKAEAYKEFAERLKEKYKRHFGKQWTAVYSPIDNTVKEKTGECKE